MDDRGDCQLVDRCLSASVAIRLTAAAWLPVPTCTGGPPSLSLQIAIAEAAMLSGRPNLYP
jgi:hypothetical protein